MRISDWSSDVCSSDLVGSQHRAARQHSRRFDLGPVQNNGTQSDVSKIVQPAPMNNTGVSDQNIIANERIVITSGNVNHRIILDICSISDCYLTKVASYYRIIQTTCEIGRASCRERVCQYV